MSHNQQLVSDDFFSNCCKHNENLTKNIKIYNNILKVMQFPTDIDVQLQIIISILKSFFAIGNTRILKKKPS